MAKLLVSKDLFFITKVKEVAQQTGVTMEVVKGLAALEAATANADTGTTLMVDLEKCGAPLEEVLPLCVLAASKGARLVGFFSHVHEDLAATAQNLGCSEVMPRSRFVKVLPELLSS